MSSPPSYTNPVDPTRDRLPPYRAKHAFANSEEELAALKKFAESKQFVQPGADGTLPDLSGGGWGIKSLAWGGPMQQDQGVAGERGWPAPETDEERKRRRVAEKAQKKEEKARKGSVGERLRRVISGGSSKEGGQ